MSGAAPPPPDAPAAPVAPEAALLDQVAVLLQGDLALVAEDYRLLTALTEAARRKYQDMGTVTRSLTVHTADLHAKYRAFEPYLERVAEICESVAAIENTVMLLDDYTLRLEAKLRTKDAEQ